MRFGVFYEHQLPRPWSDHSEAQLLRDALEQVQLADRLGFDYVWEVEHHFLEEYSHSSAPEIFLAAASQRTERIRLAHGIVNVMPAVNHPARVAERVATLDLISGGRTDFGTGESSSAAELGGFLVRREEKRDMWHEELDAITRMFVEVPFAGLEGRHVRMPPRNVIPKPLQRPHPPLWVACSRRETIHLAARNGIGALSFSFVEPEDAAKWVREYYDLLSSHRCIPAGFAVNANVAVVLPMMLADDEGEAIKRGIDGAHFFGYSLAHYYVGRHVAGETDLWREFEQRREETGFARHVVRTEQAPLTVRLLQEGLGSLRGAIGTPAQVAELIERYQTAGVDQMIFVLQAGRNRHEHICESLELFADQVMPGFLEGRAEREAAKEARLRAPIEAALARRDPPRTLASPYLIDEQTELAGVRRRLRRALPERRLGELALRHAGAAARGGAIKLVARLLDGAGDAQLERGFGHPIAQRALFAGMARSFRPEAAGGFQGRLVYELARPATEARAICWTIDVTDGRAASRPGAAADAKLTVRFQLADFIRVAGTSDPAAALLENRASVEGDLALAARLAEMFVGESGY